MPVSVDRLRELIDLARESGVESLEVVEDGTTIRIRRNGAKASGRPSTVRAKPPTIVSRSPDVFVSPMFGVFHLTPSPGATPFVGLGDEVGPESRLCLIEAMKMFTSILCDRAGRIDAVLAEPGTEVSIGQPLFRIVER